MAQELIVSPRLVKAWNRHVKRWQGCKLCPLKKTREQVVFARGKIPANILFIGEAPGQTEDALGYPFVGRSGKLLDQIIAKSIEGPPARSALTIINYTYCISNIVACVPLVRISVKDRFGGLTEKEALRAPNEFEAGKCQPRLAELVAMVKPKGIVLLGKVAESYFNPASFNILDSVPSREIPTLALYHPSYLLRKGGASHRNPDYKATWWKLRDFVREVLKGGGK